MAISIIALLIIRPATAALLVEDHPTYSKSVNW